jgi:hypothetical protein
MLYRGSRSDVPSSAYGNLLDLIEMTGWTLDLIGDAPADLIDEMMLKMQKRALVQKETNAG